LTQGSFTLEVGGTTTIGAGATGVFVGSGSALTLNGDLTLSSGSTWTKGAGTVVFSAGSAQAFTDSNGTKQDIGDVQISVNGGNTTLNLSSSVKMTSLTEDVSQFFNCGANTLELTGDGTPLALSGSANCATSTVHYTGTTVNVTALPYNNITLGGTGTYTMPGTTMPVSMRLGERSVDVDLRWSSCPPTARS